MKTIFFVLLLDAIKLTTILITLKVHANTSPDHPVMNNLCTDWGTPVLLCNGLPQKFKNTPFVNKSCKHIRLHPVKKTKIFYIYLNKRG